MQYVGGKSKISKDLTRFLNSRLTEKQVFVDLFCGSCNIIMNIDTNRLRIANDKHYYLICMWKALQRGWIPPTEFSKEEYLELKYNYSIEPFASEPHLTGFIGFSYSYGGKWFDSYIDSRDGYSYCLSGHNSVLRKLTKLQDVQFYNLDYRELDIPKSAMVYCDIPYKNADYYTGVEKFNHAEFYEWAKINSNKYDIYISEYLVNLQEEFDIVWQKDIKKVSGLNRYSETTEILMQYNPL